MTTRWWKTCVALLLVSLGVVQGGPLVELFGDVVCVLLGGCAGR